MRNRDHSVRLGTSTVALCVGLCLVSGCGDPGNGSADGPLVHDGPADDPHDFDGPVDGPGAQEPATDALTDAGPSADAGPCPGGDGAQELVPTSAMFPGPRTICGTVSFPTASSGRQMRFVLRQPGIGAEVIDVGNTDAIDHVHYHVTVDPGTYLIGFEVDEVVDMVLGPGDYRGFYDGTLVAPKKLEADATPIDVTTGDRTDIAFGLGVYP